MYLFCYEEIHEKIQFIFVDDSRYNYPRLMWNDTKHYIL